MLTNTNPNLPPRANNYHGYLIGEKYNFLLGYKRLISMLPYSAS